MIPHQLIDHIQTEEAQDFIQKHSGGDLTSLLFKFSKNYLKKGLISQLIQRKKLASKLSQWVSNPFLLFPINVSSEQSSSEATARFKSQLINGEKLLDLNGGMGVDTFYLSQSFKKAVYIEQQKELADITRHNFRMLGASDIEVFSGDGIEFLQESDADFIYADPARRDENQAKVHDLKDYEPNLIPYLSLLIKDGRKCLIKSSPMVDIPKAVEQLQYVAEVWVISHKNDCKEVCFLLHENSNSAYAVKAYNIKKDGVEEFDFLSSDKNSPSLAMDTGEFLYEPNASVQKAHGTDAVAKTFGLDKLHPNTNILSGSLKENFPGKRFKVIEILKPYDRSLRKKYLNVISRNYPDKASVIEKKLQLKGSQTEYLIALKTADDNYKFVHATLQ